MGIFDIFKKKDQEKNQLSNPAQMGANMLFSPTKKKVTTGVLHPQTSADNDMVALGIDMITKAKDGNTIISEYSPKLDTGTFNSVVSITNDITQGSGKQELMKAYPTITPSVIKDLHDVNESIINPPKKPSVVKNVSAGVVSEIPKMGANILSMLVRKPQGPVQWAQEISALVQGEESPNKKLSNEVKRLGDEAQKEITKKIGADPKTMAYKFGKLIAEVAPFFVAPALGGEAFGTAGAEAVTSKVSTLAPKLTKFITNPFVQRIIQKSIASIPSSEATTILSKGELASPKQIVGGMALNAVIPGGTIAKEQKLLGTIGEQQTGREIIKGAERGNITTPSLLKKLWSGVKVKVNPSPKAVAATNTIKKVIKDFSVKPAELLDQIRGKLDTVTGKKVGGALTQHSDEYKGMLQGVNISTMTKEKKVIMDNMKALINGAGDILSPVKKQTTALVNKIKTAKDMSVVRDAFIDFKKLIPKAVKEGESMNGREQVLYTLYKPIEKSVNSFIDTVSTSQKVMGTAEKRKIIEDLMFAKNQLIKNMPVLSKASKGAKQIIGGTISSVTKLAVLGAMLQKVGVEKSGVAE